MTPPRQETLSERDLFQSLAGWDPSRLRADRDQDRTLEVVLADLPSEVRNTLQKHMDSGTLKFLGTGSSRVTFDVGRGAVLKLARNAAGQTQNKAEAQVGRNPGTKEFIPRTLKWDDKSWKWIVVEKVEPVSSEEYEDLMKIRVVTRSGDVVQGPSLADALVENHPTDFKELYWDSLTPAQRRLVNLTWKHDILPGDLGNPSHWGRTADGRLVLLDPGLTGEGWKANYA